MPRDLSALEEMQPERLVHFIAAIGEHGACCPVFTVIFPHTSCLRNSPNPVVSSTGSCVTRAAQSRVSVRQHVAVCEGCLIPGPVRCVAARTGAVRYGAAQYGYAAQCGKCSGALRCSGRRWLLCRLVITRGGKLPVRRR